MTTVTQILKSKPDRTVYTIAPTASVLEAVRLMAEKNIGGLLVLEGGNVVGVVTERDLARLGPSCWPGPRRTRRCARS